MTNREFAAKDASFVVACADAGIPPTRRQASKYRASKGAAYSGNRVYTRLHLTKGSR